MKVPIDLPYPKNAIHAAMQNTSYLYNIPDMICEEAINRAKPRERNIITRHFRDNMALKKIAQADGVTQTRISQLYHQGLLRMRSYLAKHTSLKPLSEREKLIHTINLADYPRRITDADNDICCEKCGQTIPKFDGYDASFIVADPFCQNIILGQEDLSLAYRTHKLCKGCAYSISPFVIEPDGKKHIGIGRKHSI